MPVGILQFVKEIQRNTQGPIVKNRGLKLNFNSSSALNPGLYFDVGPTRRTLSSRSTPPPPPSSHPRRNPRRARRRQLRATRSPPLPRCPCAASPPLAVRELSEGADCRAVVISGTRGCGPGRGVSSVGKQREGGRDRPVCDALAVGALPLRAPCQDLHLPLRTPRVLSTPAPPSSPRPAAGEGQIHYQGRRQGKMSSSRSRNARWWNEDDSDVEDLLFIEGLREGSRRSKRKKFRGSLPGRHNLPRDIAGGHDRFYKDYFANNCVYPEKHFRRRFRMFKSLFLRIVAAMEAHDDYFRQKPNAAGVLGASPIQKVIAAFWMLAYGSPADFLDGYVRLGESTIIECLSHFVEAVVNVFGEEYLRAPNAKDIERLMAINSARGFPEMYGSVDCMHWKWDKCPTSWRGAYTGHKDGPTMILEAVASQDLWIWHAFFGLPGSLNDINVLRRSPLFDSLTSGTALEVEYMVNGNKYTMGYYLADGIYPAWATFVKAFQDPQTNKKRHFKRVQEAARKDVERAFGVLQARFAIVRGPARFWCKEQLWYIMQACVVLHNMIIEDERDQEDDFDYDQGKPILQPKDYEHRDPILIEQFLKIHEEIEDKSLHEQLRDDLTEHLWALHSAG